MEQPMLTLYETYSASDMANIFDVRVADLDFGDQDGLHNLLLAKNGNVLFVYNLDTTNGDLDFVSADKFVWRVRGGQKRISTNPSSPGNLLIAGTTTMNDVTASSNVILIEDEPGNYADILRKNLKPDRAEQDKTSTVFLFVTSSLRPQLLYVGQLWFNQVGWHFRRVDGSP